MKRSKPRKPFASPVAFDGACLKLRRVKGQWRCEPQSRPRRDAQKFPRHTKKD